MRAEHDFEPVRGLPGHLPPGERMLWQGAPDWRVLLRTAFHGRTIAIYFLILAAVGLVLGSPVGAAMTIGAGLLCLGVLALLAWATARATVYTLTDRRVVLRIGVALPKCFNLPLKLVESADLALTGGGHGDIALQMGSEARISYLLLWPHARPWRLKRTQPMLRAIPDAQIVAKQLTRACAALVPIERAVEIGKASPAPVAEAMPVGVAA